jgi:hypothetical protein
MLATKVQQRSCCIGGKKAAFTRAAGVRAVRPSVGRRGQRSVVVEARVSFFPCVLVRPPLQTKSEERPKPGPNQCGSRRHELAMVADEVVA